MGKLKLSLGFGSNARTRPVLNGEIEPDGIDLAATAVHGSELFWRQLKFAEFDVSELSMSSLLIALSRGEKEWIALPIFTSRQFFHTGILARNDRGIEKVEDLKGKKVGVPEYQQTAALWTRGVMEHEFGVAPKDVEWYMERTEAVSHGGSTGFTPPPGVTVNRIPLEKNIGSMLDSGELDATILYLPGGNLVDRSRLDLTRHPKVKKIFSDGVTEGARFYKKTGLFPINHGVVVRRKIYEENPWVALNLFNAFNKAKDQWLANVRDYASTHQQLGYVDKKALEFDPYQYGVKSNQLVLDTITQYSHEQGLTPRKLSMEEIFAPSTLDL